MTGDDLVYRCLVPSSIFPPRETWQRPCAWRCFFPLHPPPIPKPSAAVSSPEVPAPPPFDLCCPGSLPPSSHPVSPGHPDRDTVRLWRDLGSTWAEGSTLECHDGRTRTISDTHLLQNRVCCTVTVAVSFSLPSTSPGISVTGGGDSCAMTSQEFPTAAGPGTPTWEQPRTTRPGPPILRQDY